jgi:hypothetical protein
MLPIFFLSDIQFSNIKDDQILSWFYWQAYCKLLCGVM